MTVYDLKPAFQNLLRPVAHRLARSGIRANDVTLAALGLSAIQGAAMWISHLAPWSLLALPPVLFVRMALNAVDGMMARECGDRSELGAFLNETGDLLSDMFLYLPLALLPGFCPVVVAFVLAGAVNEFAGVLAWAVTGRRRYDGPMGKSDRAMLVGLYAFVAGLGHAGAWGIPLLGLATGAALAGAANRIRKALA